MSRLAVALALLISILARPVAGQVAVVLTGVAGASFDIDDRDPETGGGFSFLTGIGLRLSRISFGAEFGQHAVGQDRKAKQYGVFLRLPATTGGRVEPYFVLGVADYRYSPAAGGKSHSPGGSVGPGVLLNVASSPVRVLFEVRFHTSFDRISTISSQDYVAVGAGLGFSF
jgi:hypothetical protein